ncbi:hypothetical protein BSKO_12819 [Bryopsis sp. KO-2023]|nr:hypothetical protein BSKO_12819 [Bryopsis sp. KO-2023]
MLWRSCSGVIRRAIGSSFSGEARLLTQVAAEDASERRLRFPDGPDLHHFLQGTAGQRGGEAVEPQETTLVPENSRKVYLETYGCQMNVSDSEVVMSVLASKGYTETKDLTDAHLILINTCAIRDKPERRVWNRMVDFRKLKNSARKENRDVPVVGVLGCMAERLKHELLDVEKLADLVVGPDAYRDLPRLLDVVQDGEGAMNTQLSLEETYADVVPLRPMGAVKAFLTIMRGCNNMCSFCIVPFTRGRERSRPVESILSEVRQLSDSGVKEVTLLGQNVNSYSDFSIPSRYTPGSQQGKPFEVYAEGFQSVYKPKRNGSVQFAELLERVAEVDPEMRVRFTSPHPKDFSDDVLQVVAEHHNVCSQLHLPAQSGSTTCLERMKRGYSREAYDNLVEKARQRISGVALSTDIIAGFCGETEVEHDETLDLMDKVGYESGFLFKYSERNKTHASRHLKDDVTEEVKGRRLSQIINMFRKRQMEKSAAEIGRQHLVLVEGKAQKSDDMWTGKTDTLKRVVFPDRKVPSSLGKDADRVSVKPGDYVVVDVASASHSTLGADPVARTTIQEYYRVDS